MFRSSSFSEVFLPGSTAVGLTPASACARAAFIVAFFAVRVIGWIPVSVDFWSDVLALLPGGGAPTHAMPTAVAYSWLFFHLGLTLLQFHWGRLIASAAYAMLVGDASTRANEAKSA